MRYPIEARAIGVIIEQLFGKPAAVVVAGAKEKNRVQLVPPRRPINYSNPLLRAAAPPPRPGSLS
jgi:hypothetical protein